MTKVSDFSALTGAGVDQANDLLEIVDMSEAGAARNKKITVAELLGLVTVTGLLDLKGSTDCSANPNYPAASKGDIYIVSVAGKIGGASGKVVEVGDFYLALADNAGGTEASVGTSWAVLQANITGGIGSGVDVEDEGVSEATGATTLNFVGAGVTASDAGGGVVDITIPGSGGTFDLGDADDVDTTGQADKDILGYVSGSSEWQPRSRLELGVPYLIEKVTVAAGDPAVITSFAGLGLAKVVFIISFTVATDDSSVTFRYQLNGSVKSGSNYLNTALSRRNDDTTSNEGATNVSTIRLTDLTAAWMVGNASGEGLSSQIEIADPDSTTRNKVARIRSEYINPAGGVVIYDAAATYNGADALDGLEGVDFGASSNVTGTIWVYGFPGV